MQRITGVGPTAIINPGTYGLTAPPTLDEMLVPGSPAAELLASMFTAEQQPHLALPTAIEPVTSAAGGGRHRRELQRSDGSADGVRITVQ